MEENLELTYVEVSMLSKSLTSLHAALKILIPSVREATRSQLYQEHQIPESMLPVEWLALQEINATYQLLQDLLRPYGITVDEQFVFPWQLSSDQDKSG